MRPLLAALVVLCLVPSAALAAPETVTIPSRADGTPIVVSVYKPAGASAGAPAPVILHSHGWGGSRTSSDGAFATELAAGYGVVSIDQRGHGASGGEANVEDPDFEGQDMISVIDYVAGLDWVAKDTNTGHPNDPVLFSMGGSYGGGYQFVAAFTELRDLGYTRLNALARRSPGSNLSESLAPSKVVRTAWVSALYGAGAPMLPSTSTARSPTARRPVSGPTARSRPSRTSTRSSSSTARPVTWPRAVCSTSRSLFGQGLTDNLFNLNQGWKNFEQALTPGARSRSLLVGYNGGHALPNVLPVGTTGGRRLLLGHGRLLGPAPALLRRGPRRPRHLLAAARAVQPEHADRRVRPQPEPRRPHRVPDRAGPRRQARRGHHDGAARRSRSRSRAGR